MDEAQKLTLKESLIKKFGPKLIEAGPKIGLGAGIALVAAGLYFTWRAGKKHDDLMAEIADDLETIHNMKPEMQEVVNDETGETEMIEVVTEGKLTRSDYQKKLSLTYLKDGARVAAVWAPPLACVGCGVGLIVKSFGTLENRLSDMSAAYMLMSNGYSAYRAKVRDQLGEEADKEFAYGLKEKTIEKPYLDKKGMQKVDKDGNLMYKKDKGFYLDGFDMSEFSPFAIIFDAQCPTYRINSESGCADEIYNDFFIDSTERLVNMRLHAKRVLFLNDVYEALGAVRTAGTSIFRDCRIKAGQINGWVADKGDGIIFTKIPYTDDNGNTCYVIDLNVQGPVIDYLDE